MKLPKALSSAPRALFLGSTLTWLLTGRLGSLLCNSLHRVTWRPLTHGSWPCSEQVIQNLEPDRSLNVFYHQALRSYFILLMTPMSGLCRWFLSLGTTRAMWRLATTMHSNEGTDAFSAFSEVFVLFLRNPGFLAFSLPPIVYCCCWQSGTPHLDGLRSHLVRGYRLENAGWSLSE